jgi:hypothetical protein
MPYGDGTGPEGMGSMTGRRAGFCAGYSTPGYLNQYPGGTRFARGGGRGWRHNYHATGLPGWVRARQGYPAWGGGATYFPYAPELTPEKEAEVLTNQAQMMQGEIDSINERIKELEKMTAKKKD